MVHGVFFKEVYGNWSCIWARSIWYFGVFYQEVYGNGVKHMVLGVFKQEV